MMEQKLVILAILVISKVWVYDANAKGHAIYDITKFGAKPDRDISKALLKAWVAACGSPNSSKISIPPGTWKLTQVKLQGPNKAPIELEIQGTVKAYADPHKLPNKHGEWITINYVNYFTLSGGGVFDGQGHQAWKMNDCRKNKNCMRLPINLSFNFIKNSYIHDVTTKNSKNFHVNCISSHNVTFQRFRISAPGNSPNTDGIHIGRDSMINIIDSIIETGDDCISMGDELTQVHIQNVTCGPGHGISIGSLGGSLAEKDVSKIYVTNCTFIGTQNGVRVKTWPSAPATLKISDLQFEDLTMVNANNPIIIDQQYCPSNLCTLNAPSLIQISNVTVKNIRGTTNSAEALIFSCSHSKPCQNVKIGDINLTYTGKHGRITTKCANIKPTIIGKQNIPICGTSTKSI